MRSILKGATDQSTVIRIVDSADGTPETGVDGGSPGPDFWYRREGGAKVPFVAVTLASLTAAHADGGLEHIGDGYYRLDVPDAAFASGADGVVIGGSNTGMVVIGAYHQLVEFELSGSEGARLRRALLGTITGTVGSGSTTTTIVAASTDPDVTVTDQFLGKVLTFDKNTATANLRGQSTRITGVTPYGSPQDIQLAVDALTTAPASGDTFSIS